MYSLIKSIVRRRVSYSGEKRARKTRTLAEKFPECPLNICVCNVENTQKLLGGVGSQRAQKKSKRSLCSCALLRGRRTTHASMKGFLEVFQKVLRTPFLESTTPLGVCPRRGSVVEVGVPLPTQWLETPHPEVAASSPPALLCSRSIGMEIAQPEALEKACCQSDMPQCLVDVRLFLLFSPVRGRWKGRRSP